MNERHLVHRQMEDYRSGVIAAILCNVNRGKDTKAFEPSDFFSSLPRSKSREMSGEQMLAYVKNISSAFGKSKKR